MENTSLKPINKLVLTSLLIATAVVINFFRVDLPLTVGASVLRVSFSAPFLAFVSIICGPTYGTIAGALIDIIGYVLRPTGAYIPFLTITAASKGLLFWLFWIVFKKINHSYLPILMTLGLSSTIITAINTYILKFFIPALASKAFVVILIPRLVETILILPIEAFILVSAIGVYKKINYRRFSLTK